MKFVCDGINKKQFDRFTPGQHDDLKNRLKRTLFLDADMTLADQINAIKKFTQDIF